MPKIWTGNHFPKKSVKVKVIIGLFSSKEESIRNIRDIHLKAKLVSEVQIILFKRVAGSEELQ